MAAFEQRTFATAEVHAPGRPVAAARGPALLDLEALVAAALAGFHDGAPQTAEPGEPAVVLGPVAVAQVLEALKPELAGPEALLAARRGAPLAAPCVTLADDARHAGTLPRSYDAEGVPRAAVTLIAGGVAQGVVRDTASGATTGHATRPGHAEPWPEHLVLAGGEAAGEDELAAPIALGLAIPAFLVSGDGLAARRRPPDRGRRADVAGRRRRRGRPARRARRHRGADRRARLVPTDDDSALTVGATLAPALRALGGIAIIG